MGDKHQILIEREVEIRRRINSLVDEDVAAAVAGGGPSHSNEINRLTQDLNTIHIAMDRVRHPA